MPQKDLTAPIAADPAVPLAPGAGDRPRAGAGPEETAAEYLAAALRRADVPNAQELARSIAPGLITALCGEISDAPPPKPASAPGSALGGLLSLRGWRLRMRSLQTGRPLRDLLLELDQRPKLRGLLALDRDSGRLLAKWRPEGLAAEMTSTLAAAIKAFATKEFSSANSETRVMTFRSSRIFLRASSGLVLAAEFAGEPHGDDKARIDRAFGALIRKDSADDRDLARASADFLSGANIGPVISRQWLIGLCLAAAALVAGLAFFALSARNQSWDERLQDALASEQDAQPQLRGWPLSLSVDHDRRVAVMSGVAPADANLDALTQALTLAAAPYRLQMQVTPVETAASTAAAQARQLEQMTVATQQIKAVEGRVDGLDARLRAAEQWRKEQQAEADTPAMRLASLAEKTVILFKDDDNFLDSDIAHRQLSVLAAALKASGGGLRVVGHTDSHGSLINNRSLSKGRAQTVIDVLLAEGVATRKLVAAARADQAPIAVEDGAERRRNRRVTFEVLEESD